MTRCDRFDTEALLRIEQGLPLDDHFATCPDCLQARAAYDRLRAGISSLGSELSPPERWQAETWRRIEARRARRRRWRPWVFTAGLAAAVVAFALLRTPQSELAVASLAVEVETGGTARRGAEAHPGDRLSLRASTGGAPHAELRVYRNDRELLLRCPGDQGCAPGRGTLRGSLDLDAAGNYQPLLLVGERPFPPPRGDLDRDTAAAVAAGAEVEMGHPVVVR